MLCNCPRSYRFFSTMPVAELAVVHQFVMAGWKVLPTGSRYICPRQFVRDDSDWDVMVLNEPGMEGDALPSRYSYEGLYVASGKSGVSFTAGMLNVIMLEAIKWQAWKEATEFACESVLCWQSREQRVDVFKKMEKIVIHRALDAIIENRGPSPVHAAMQATKHTIGLSQKTVMATTAIVPYWQPKFVP